MAQYSAECDPPFTEKHQVRFFVNALYDNTLFQMPSVKNSSASKFFFQDIFQGCQLTPLSKAEAPLLRMAP